MITVLVFAITGCDTLVEPNGDENNTTLTLAGTSWKLTAFVDAENNTSREPSYIDTLNGVEIDSLFGIAKDSMYTLTFENDSIMSGRINYNQIGGGQFGLYFADYDTNNLLLRFVIQTMMCCDFGDGLLYANILTGIDKSLHFELYPQVLHIFYNDGKEYLKFNKIEEVCNVY
jgi:hypothetical protein